MSYLTHTAPVALAYFVWYDRTDEQQAEDPRGIQNGLLLKRIEERSHIQILEMSYSKSGLMSHQFGLTSRND